MNPVPKLLFLALALAAASAHAITCPAPIEVPEGEGIEASPHVCGALGVFTQHGKKGFFDPHSGAVVVPAQFDAVVRDYVADTLTPVMKGEHWAYVDTQGKAHTAWEFDQVSLFLYDDALAIVGKDGRYGMINRNGETAVPLEYDRLDGFMRPENGYNYLTVACKAGKCGYLDEKGKTVIALEYDDAGGFGADVAPVKKRRQMGLHQSPRQDRAALRIRSSRSLHPQHGQPRLRVRGSTKKRQARGDRPAGQNPAGKHTLHATAAAEHLDRSCRTAFTYTMSAQAYV